VNQQGGLTPNSLANACGKNGTSIVDGYFILLIAGFM
jgi:hypothetical protein